MEWLIGSHTDSLPLDLQFIKFIQGKLSAPVNLLQKLGQTMAEMTNSAIFGEDDGQGNRSGGAIDGIKNGFGESVIGTNPTANPSSSSPTNNTSKQSNKPLPYQPNSLNSLNGLKDKSPQSLKNNQLTSPTINSSQAIQQRLAQQRNNQQAQSQQKQAQEMLRQNAISTQNRGRV